MIIFGRIMFVRPPKKINDLYGYRTPRSMKNQDTWDFAHKYCGKIWWIAGWILFAITIVISMFFIKSSVHTIGILLTVMCIVQCVIMIITIFPVERALKNNFDAYGQRKNQNKDDILIGDNIHKDNEDKKDN